MKGKKLTQSQAIRAMCRSCIYDDAGLGNGTEIQQIEDCTSLECPLYEWRALTGKTKERIKQEAYDALSDEEKVIADAEHERKAKLFKDRMAK